MRVHTSEAPGNEFEKAVEAHEHTASVEVDESVFTYAAPELHTVATDGQAVTGELDEIIVGDAA